MAQDLYTADFVAWSAQQAELLRRLAAGERVNDALDWGNLIEEVECLGRSETRAVRSLLTQAMVHALKIARWPENDAVLHWRGEAIGFLGQAQGDFLPSMALNIDVATCFREARRRVLSTRLPGPAHPIPETTPLTLRDLMDTSADLGALVDALGGGAA